MINDMDYQELLGVDTDCEECEYGYCANCGDPLGPDDSCIGFETPDGEKILLCGDCESDMTVEELLSLIGIVSYTCDAEYVSRKIGFND